MEERMKHQRPRGHEKFTWSNADKRYLLKNYATTDNEELAQYYGKSVRQVASQASRQHLTKEINNDY